MKLLAMLFFAFTLFQSILAGNKGIYAEEIAWPSASRQNSFLLRYDICYFSKRDMLIGIATQSSSAITSFPHPPPSPGVESKVPSSKGKHIVDKYLL